MQQRGKQYVEVNHLRNHLVRVRGLAMKRWLACLLGALGAWLTGRAYRIDAHWEPLRRITPYPGELDEVLSVRNCPTWPTAPPVASIDEDNEVTERRLVRCVPPPAPVRSERRVICVGDERISVTPPAGSWWSQGGRS